MSAPLTPDVRKRNRMDNIYEGYTEVHQWIKKNFGKAHKCENENCKCINIKRYEWALRTGLKYEKDISHFIQLCVSCHRKMDVTEITRAKMRANTIGVPQDHNKVSIVGVHVDTYDRVEYKSASDAAKELGIKRNGIVNCLKNRQHHAAGYKWFYQSEFNAAINEK